MVKILHLADLHLDSPFKGIPQSEAAERRTALRGVFSDALDYASNVGAAMVLLSGDLFDGEYYSQQTLEFLENSFRSMPQCQFVIAPGNHDTYKYSSPYKNCDFPENVRIFTSEKVNAFEYPELGVTVYGYAFTSNSYQKRPLEGFHAESDGFSILCAHADTENKMSVYAPITENDLVHCGLDYAALGHIHTKPEIMRAGSTVYAYSGCVAGRDFSEYGEKGGILVTLDKKDGRKTVDAQRVRFCPWVYETISSDISECGDINEALELIKDRISGLISSGSSGVSSSGYMLKLRLTGYTCFEPDTEYLKKQLHSLGVRQIDDQTVLFDYLGLENDFTIRGEFYRKLKSYLCADVPEVRQTAALALRYGLAALDGSELTEIN